MKSVAKNLILTALFGLLFQVNQALCDLMSGRVIGGTDADIRDFPYQVAIRVVINNQDSHACGGSILNENTILTAAHCVDWLDFGFYIRAGTSMTGSGGHDFEITAINIHPKWNITTIDFDVAVLKIEPAIVFDETMQPIRLPEPHSDVPGGIMVNLTGWGVTYDESDISAEILQFAQNEVMDRDECIAMHDDADHFPDIPSVSARNICAGGNGTSSCRGDSGGPLVFDGQIVGIVSWGVPPCAVFPSIFMRVSYFLDFIESFL